MKNIYIFVCIFLFSQNINAQDYTKTPESSPTILLKLAPASLAEYASCLHLAAEIRFDRLLSLQPEVGYFSDVLRNPDYSPTNSMEGVRFGGGLRFYFHPVRTDKFNWYAGCTLLVDNAKIRQSADAYILEKGKAKFTTTNITYNYSRFTTDCLIGFQRDFNKKWSIEAYTGLGFMADGSANIQTENPDAFLYRRPYYYTPFAIRSPFFGQPSPFITGGVLNIALGVKIGYRLL